MGSKQKEVKLKDILPTINYSNEIVNSTNVVYMTQDCTFYTKMKHVVLNKTVFVRADDAFALVRKVQEINNYVETNHIFNDTVKNLINDIVLLCKKVDSYNEIDHSYKVVIKNKKIYIL